MPARSAIIDPNIERPHVATAIRLGRAATARDPVRYPTHKPALVRSWRSTLDAKSWPYLALQEQAVIDDLSIEHDRHTIAGFRVVQANLPFSNARLIRQRQAIDLHDEGPRLPVAGRRIQ